MKIFHHLRGKPIAISIMQNIGVELMHQAIIIEDNPYGELRFKGEALPSVKFFDSIGCVLCSGTFSKTLCPGYRIGWIAGDKYVIQKYVLVKQATDLQCNTMAQREIAKYVELYDIDDHIAKIR